MPRGISKRQLEHSLLYHYGVHVYNLKFNQSTRSRLGIASQLASLYKQLANFQLHVQLACRKGLLFLRGQSNISSTSTPCPRSFSPFYHLSTLTRLPDIQALLFPNSTSISFFIPPINTVFYLIEHLMQYFVLLNDCDKEQKKESLCRRQPRVTRPPTLNKSTGWN